MDGATFTTEGTTIGYTAEEYYRIANAARRSGNVWLGIFLLNLGDNAQDRPESEQETPYRVIVHPATARAVFACGG